MELVTKKKLLLYTGDAHPALAEEIADRLGYADAFHLSKVFKQEVGVSPRAYRHRLHAK